MPLTRRQLLAAAGAAVAGLGASKASPRSTLGIVEHSFSVRIPAGRAQGGPDRIDDPLSFVNYCAGLGAGGVQMSLGSRDPDYIRRLRSAVETHRMYLEGSIRLPRDENDTARFEAEIRTAKDSGATVARTVAMTGRRYETFNSQEAFRTFADRAYRSLTLAEPIVARHNLRLAVENHKDWRLPELVGLLKRIDSRHVGACVDTGNSIALLEDPREVVEALAPWAFSTHLKDMGVEEYPDGFLLSEVPLGTGFLDLPAIVSTLRKARPDVRFILEMITRDPLKIPCLTDKYWATLPDVPGGTLARALASVRSHTPREPLPRVARLSTREKLEAEEANVVRSLAYARDKLGLVDDR